MSDYSVEKSYPFNEIEPKWQAYWEEHKTFKTENDFSKPAT